MGLKPKKSKRAKNTGPLREYTPQQIERIAAITNHVSEGMLDLVTKRDLVDAVKYWSLEHSYRCSELSSLEAELLMLATRGAIKKVLDAATDVSAGDKTKDGEEPDKMSPGAIGVVKDTFHFSITHAVFMGRSDLAYTSDERRAKVIARALSWWIKSDDGKAWWRVVLAEDGYPAPTKTARKKSS